MGSIIAARRAGRYEANSAVAKRIKPTETITEKSVAPTPYKVVRIVRPTNREPARPNASPTNASRDASPQNQPDHVYPARAQGEPQTDLVGPLRDRKRHEPVNADGRQKQGDHGEAGKQHHRVSVLAERFLLHIIKSAKIRQGDLRVNGMDGRSDGLAHGRGIFGGADADRDRWLQRLSEWDVHLGKWVAEISVPDVVKDTDNPPLDRRPELRDPGNHLFNRHALLQRVHAFQVTTREFLVHYRHSHA